MTCPERSTWAWPGALPRGRWVGQGAGRTPTATRASRSIAANTGWSGSIAVSHEATRSGPLGAAELVDDLLAVEGGRAVPGERATARIAVEVGRPDRRVQGRDQLGRHRPQVVRGLGRLVDGAIALDDDDVEPHGPSKHSPPRRLDGHQRSGRRRGRGRGAAGAARDTATRRATRATRGRSRSATASHGRPTADGPPTVPATPGRLSSRPCPSCAAGSTPRADETRANHEAMAGLVADLRTRQDGRRRSRRRRRRPLDRPPPRARQAAGPRAHRPADRPRLGVPRAEPARRHRPLRRRRARGRHRHRHRPRRGHDLRRSSPTTRPSRAAPTTR